VPTGVTLMGIVGLDWRRPEPRPGDEALLAIRPTGISLETPGTGAGHLAGQVADVAFRGRGYEYAVDLPGLGRLTGVLATRRAERGEEVALRLDPDGCHLFPADEPSARV
jgi:iron(III) transport system ATP-binding protein